TASGLHFLHLRIALQRTAAVACAISGLLRFTRRIKEFHLLAPRSAAGAGWAAENPRRLHRIHELAIGICASAHHQCPELIVVSSACHDCCRLHFLVSANRSFLTQSRFRGSPLPSAACFQISFYLTRKWSCQIPLRPSQMA